MGQGGGNIYMDVRTDGQIPPVFYSTLSPSGPLPKNVIKSNGPNDRRTNGMTNGPNENWLIESCSTRLKMNAEMQKMKVKFRVLTEAQFLVACTRL